MFFFLLPYLQSKLDFIQGALLILFMFGICSANMYSAIRLDLKDIGHLTLLPERNMKEHLENVLSFEGEKKA